MDALHKPGGCSDLLQFKDLLSKSHNRPSPHQGLGVRISSREVCDASRMIYDISRERKAFSCRAIAIVLAGTWSEQSITQDFFSSEKGADSLSKILRQDFRM